MEFKDHKISFRMENNGEPVTQPVVFCGKVMQPDNHGIITINTNEYNQENSVIVPDKDGNVRFVNQDLDFLDIIAQIEAKENEKINKAMDYVLTTDMGPYILGLTEEEFKKVCDKKEDLPEELKDMPDEIASLNCHPTIIKPMPPTSTKTTNMIAKLRRIVDHYAKHTEFENLH